MNLYLFAMREGASEDERDRIDDELEPPNRWDAARRAPHWWVDEEEAWQGFEVARRV